MRIAASLALALALSCLPGGLQDAPTPTLAACQSEDGPGPCRWDAQARGNGEGRSFTIECVVGPHGNANHCSTRYDETGETQ